jgi:uncharacterized membrane protein YhaH (DUF805 family)
MTFGAAVQSCLSKYATFTGRAPRSEFWWFWVFTILVDIAAVILGSVFFTSSFSNHGMGGSVHGWSMMAYPGWLPSIAHLLLFLPSLAVAVRRLHDVGRSGWWLLIMLVPLFGFLLLLFWWVQPSEPRDNAHGPSPSPLLPAA